jgi:exopolysaccharide production protein ExoZ
MQKVPEIFRNVEAHVPKQRSVYSALDVVRFLTATLVMIYHLFFWRNGAASRDPVGQFWRFGWVGVEIFFTLSGLVIALSAQSSTPRKFLIDRIARLAPTIWICATATLIGTLALAPATDLHPLLLDYLRTMVVLPNGHHIDIVYWTLTVEVAFYALVFLVLLMSSFRRLISVMIVIGLVSAAFDTVLSLSPFLNGPLVDAIAAASQHHITRLLLLRHGCFFALGVLIWSLKSELRPKYCGALIGLFFAAATLEVWHGAREQLQDVPTLHFSASAPVIAWAIGIVLIFFARLMPAVQLKPGVNLPVVLRFAGLLTFPIYLLHNNVGLLFEASLASRGFAPLISGLIASASILILSILITSMLEPPLARSLKAFLIRTSNAAPFQRLSELEVQKRRSVVDK